MSQVDIASYHQSRPISKSSTKTRQIDRPFNDISQFSPTLPINVFANSKQPQQNSNTQDRQSRPRENAAKTPLVPHLYAEQRVRNRSLSRDPQRPSKGSNTPSTANKELKKIVAFGRTTTVEAKNMDKNATSSFSTNHSELYRLRKDVEGLRICLTDNKQLKKDMEQTRHLLEKLNKKTEREITSISHELRNEMKEFRSAFGKMSKSLSEMNSRLDKLESRINSIDNPTESIKEVSSSKISPLPHFKSYKDHHPKQEPIESPKNALYSCLPSDMNVHIRQITDISSRNRRNFNEQFADPTLNKTYDRVIAKLQDKENYKYFDQNANRSISRQKNKTPRSQIMLSILENENNLPHKSENTRKNKSLATNQLIDLNASEDQNGDFAFDE